MATVHHWSISHICHLLHALLSI